MSNCNENYIKEAAYYLWQNAGCPNGQDEKFWSMAIEQISACSNKKACCKKSSSASSSASKKASTKSASKTSAKK